MIIARDLHVDSIQPEHGWSGTMTRWQPRRSPDIYCTVWRTTGRKLLVPFSPVSTGADWMLPR